MIIRRVLVPTFQMFKFRLGRHTLTYLPSHGTLARQHSSQSFPWPNFKLNLNFKSATLSLAAAALMVARPGGAGRRCRGEMPGNDLNQLPACTVTDSAPDSAADASGPAGCQYCQSSHRDAAFKFTVPVPGPATAAPGSVTGGRGTAAESRCPGPGPG